LANSDDVGILFDLRGEAYRNSTELVAAGELASVAGGSSGFNNAHERTINLSAVPGATLNPGDTLTVVLYVRNACAGSGKNSGRARLWYNDSAADSQVAVNLGAPSALYLLDGFLLGASAGPGPKRTINVQAGPKCSPFKPFGSWSKTLN
jgi:hypothetical protein